MKIYIRLLLPSLFLGVCLAVFSIFNNFNISANETNQAFLDREAAYRANNIGVAHLEQFNHKEAVENFEEALKLSPGLKIAQINLAIAFFNTQEHEKAIAAANKAADISPESLQPIYILGLIARVQNRTEDAEKFFQKVIAGDSQDVGANVNLGQIYIQQRKYPEAVAHFRKALEAEPYNATAMYNLATALNRSNAREEGQKWVERFQALRQSGAATNIGINYLEQGRYAEALTSTGAESELIDKTTPPNVFQEVSIGFPASPAKSSNIKNKTQNSSAVLFDLDNDGDLDLAQIPANQSQGKIFLNESGKFTNISANSGDLNKNIPVAAQGMIAGDFDNDSFADVLIFGKGQPQLLKGNGKGSFQNVTAAAKIPVSTINSMTAAFVDADHDGDLDIFLGGFKEGKGTVAPTAPNQLLRNNGDSTFTDISQTAAVNLPSSAVAVIPTDYDNRRDIDLLVVNTNRKTNLFRNLRDGSFRDVAAEAGLDKIGNWSCAAAGDFNKDTFTDFFFGQNGKGVLAVSDGRGKFLLKDAPTGTENARSSQFIDYDNDGLLDLVLLTSSGFAVSRNLGNEWTKADLTIFKAKSEPDKNFAGIQQFLSGDLDGDGDMDLIGISGTGNIRFFQNSGGKNQAEILQLQGRVSNRTGIGAKIDLRSGSLSQKLETYSASPAPAPAQVHFGLGQRQKPDAVRVIWSSGVVQAEIEFPQKDKMTTAKFERPFKIEELDRKPSSCPYLYTWNGEKFEFVTDFLGGGEMGNWQEKGVYHYPDSDEFVRITDDQLKPKNGKYEIRVTNELEEVLFLDHLKLVAVEHDAETEVYPNEGLGIPTSGQRILYTTRSEHAPLSAVNSEGKNILEKIEKLDRVFYDDFSSQKIRGYADTHQLTLNLDEKKNFKGRTLLLLTGWTDYAFSSDNLAASQSRKSLFLPKLQVKNKKGDWVTAIESIGISVGRPQTVVVDLTGKFLTDSREVRIVTNFKTYWDKIAVDTSAQSDVKTIDINPERADLSERGYSEEINFRGMIAANYEKVFNDGRWKYFSGNFTRTGAVNPLLDKVDNVFVISKTGDELTLSFPALAPPQSGKKYTFLLFADGYSKEMDINSGSPDAVLPLPFKGMKKYPYGDEEKFPMTDDKRLLYDEFTTRKVKGFLPRIETALIP